MYYLHGYDFTRCFEKDCDQCDHRWECLHYYTSTDEQEEIETQDEYRLFIVLDDNTNNLIQNLIQKIEKICGVKNLRKELYLLLKIFWSLGYNLRDIYYFIKNNWPSKGPAILDQLILWALPDQECLKYYFSSSEEDEMEVEELTELEDGRDLLSLPLSTNIIDKLAIIWNKNFTGEVRLSSEDDEYEEKIEQLLKEDINKVEEKYKKLKEIITISCGREAYSRSQDIKSYIAQLKQAGRWDDAMLWQARLAKAWQIRKKYLNLPSGERLRYFYEE